MRILLSYTLVGRGGDAIQVQALAQALRTLGHEVDLAGPIPIQPYEFTRSSSKMRSALRKFPWWFKDATALAWNVRALQRAKRQLRQRDFDLVLHHAQIYDFVSSRLAKITRCPLVVHLDSPWPLERAFRGQGYFARLHYRCMQRLGQTATLIVTVSSATRAYYLQLGLPAEKLIIIPNGISRQLLQKGALLAKAHPPFAQTEPCTIGFVGSLSRWHRVDLLLETLRLLEDRWLCCYRWRLLIVGYGEEYRRLRQQARALGLEGQIEWLGALPHEQAFEQIAQFDIAVLPNTLPTGAPLKLFEYAALARPTILPDLPNLHELFADDEMSFIQPGNAQALAEAMLNLRREPEVARELGQRAQERVQKYSWEQALGHLLEAVRNRA